MLRDIKWTDKTGRNVDISYKQCIPVDSMSAIYFLAQSKFSKLKYMCDQFSGDGGIGYKSPFQLPVIVQTLLEWDSAISVGMPYKKYHTDINLTFC